MRSLDPATPPRSRRVSGAALAAAAALVVGQAAQRALAHDLFVSSAAVDQPRINVAFAPAATPFNPFVGEGVDPNNPDDTTPTIQVPAFWDTGASGMIISEGVAEALGMNRQTFGGQDVIFSDVAPGGLTPFWVSEEVVVRIAPSLGLLDGTPEYEDHFSNPANFTTSYAATGPVPARLQIGPIGGGNPLLGDLNVMGMPTMLGKIAVFDPRPTNNFLTLIDDDVGNENFDVLMRSYMYDGDNLPGTVPGGGAPTLLNPGIPDYDVSIALSYADFSRFTTLEPAGAAPPSLAYNPFVGPNPVLGPQPGDSPPVVMRMGNLQMEGSWLLDTGAAASFISEGKAAELGVSYDPANPPGSDTPQLLGVPLDRQFTLALSGISGETITVAGFYADEMILPTEQAADPSNPDDPQNLKYVGAPVLVFDIELLDPDTGAISTLDGILGMNFFVATSDIIQIEGELFPIFLNGRESPFDAIVFDEPNGKLYLSLDGGWPVPEPSALAGLAIGLPLLLRRRASA